MAGKKGRSGGARRGAGKKPKYKALTDGEIAARVLMRANEEESLVEHLARVRLTDPRLWWDIMREMQHQSRGKPVEKRIIDSNLSIDLASRRERVEQLILALSQ